MTDINLTTFQYFCSCAVVAILIQEVDDVALVTISKENLQFILDAFGKNTHA